MDHTEKDHPQSPRRKQIKVDSVCGKEYPIFLRDIKTILQWMFPLHTIGDENLIISEEGLGVQELHTDDQNSFKDILKEDDVICCFGCIES